MDYYGFVIVNKEYNKDYDNTFSIINKRFVKKITPIENIKLLDSQMSDYAHLFEIYLGRRCRLLLTEDKDIMAVMRLGKSNLVNSKYIILREIYGLNFDKLDILIKNRDCLDNYHNLFSSTFHDITRTSFLYESHVCPHGTIKTDYIMQNISMKKLMDIRDDRCDSLKRLINNKFDNINNKIDKWNSLLNELCSLDKEINSDIDTINKTFNSHIRQREKIIKDYINSTLDDL